MEKGVIVKSVAGRDKDRFYLVVRAEQDRVFLADGKLRKLEKAKAKNIRHVRATADTLDVETVRTDKKLRELLKPYNGLIMKHAANEEGGN